MTSAVAEVSPCSLAIVVVSLVGGEALQRTLRSIAAIDAPRVVIGSSSPHFASHRQAVPAKFIAADVPVPLKRAMGLGLTDSEWVAFLEDTCDIDPGWYQAFSEIATSRAADAAGGPVVIASELPPRCMALACLEYAAFAPHRARGSAATAALPAAPTDRLAGVNLLYRRSAMPPVDAGTGLIESELNALIRQRGGRLVQHPQLGVTYRAVDAASATLSSRFFHGRIYGGGQREQASRLRRLLAMIKCFALPPVLYTRARAGLPTGCASPWRTRAWILSLSVAWSCGEFAGLLTGRGASLARWR